MGCSKLGCNLEFGVFQIDGDHFGESSQTKRLNAQQSDHAGADDGNRTTNVSGCSIGRMNCNRDRFDHGGMFERQGVRDFVDDVLRHGHELSKCALTAKLVA